MHVDVGQLGRGRPSGHGDDHRPVCRLRGWKEVTVPDRDAGREAAPWQAVGVHQLALVQRPCPTGRSRPTAPCPAPGRRPRRRAGCSVRRPRRPSTAPSVISCTSAVSWLASTTLPTSPPAPTTGLAHGHPLGPALVDRDVGGEVREVAADHLGGDDLGVGPGTAGARAARSCSCCLRRRLLLAHLQLRSLPMVACSLLVLRLQRAVVDRAGEEVADRVAARRSPRR